MNDRARDPANDPQDAPATEPETKAPFDLTGPRDETLEGRAVEVLKTVYDPEIPVNIYELGLVYDLAVTAEGRALVVMTLTSPHCPVAESLPAEVRQKVAGIQGVQDCHVELTWEPAWTPEKMSEAAKLTLGMV